ncbi:PHP domain-containing protein [Vibrio sp. PNB22_2_2]
MDKLRRYKWKVLILFVMIVLFLPLFFLLSKKPLVSDVYINPKEVKDAVDKYQYVSGVIFGLEDEIEVEISGEKLTSIFKAASHLTPNMNFEIKVSHYGAVVLGTLDLSGFINNRYVNVSCFIIPDGNNAIDSCQVGGIYVPGSLVEFGVSVFLKIVFDSGVNDIFEQFIKSIEIEDNTLRLRAIKNGDLKNYIKSGLSDISSFIKSFSSRYNNKIDPDVIGSYLEFMLESDVIMSKRKLSLSEIFNVVFQHAKERSRISDARKENEYALWAVAMAFANHRFAELIDADTYSIGTKLSNLSSKTAYLNNRNDLALHFLYSAIIERVGSEAIANNMGELKELFDANQDGSGFDISDLAADIAGARFSNFISSRKINAVHSQNLLIASHSEALFFPNVNRHRSITSADFEKVIGSTENEEYTKTIEKLQAEVQALTLYQNSSLDDLSRNKSLAIIDTIPWASNGVWLAVDTHIHTKHSDGGHSIEQIANKAVSYGCDAIAITDHSDGDLHAGSLDYFLEIEAIDRAFPTLSIISGLEWNLPPYEGREHATLLFPEGHTAAMIASQFRRQFDDYRNPNNPFSSVRDGLKWLESSFDSYPVLPAVFYNHPSRKVDSFEETLRNLEDWAKENSVFLGFSGAPGHQRVPGDKIGSYFHKFKTHDRWDPVVSEVGGVWDNLLGKGKLLWGARAPSDFHGTRGDYWPCQFSETRVYSRDNSINGVIEALRKGSFFASHGKVVRDLKFELKHDKLERPAIMGETVPISGVEKLTVNIELTLNELNWKGKPTKLEQVELIVISNETVTSQVFDVEDYKIGHRIVMSVPVLAVGGDMAIRLRGRSFQPINGDYMFYTNPIMVRAIDETN